MANDVHAHMADYSVKEVLEGFIIPQLNEIQTSLRGLEDRANQIPELKNAYDRLDKELHNAQTLILTRSDVTEMIGNSMQKAEARGWTRTERLTGVIVAVIAFSGLLLNLVQLYQSS